MDRTVVAVDLDHTLARYLDCLADWHNATHNTLLTSESFTSSDLAQVWGGSTQEAQKKLLEFFNSSSFANQMGHFEQAADVLKPFRKYFSLLVLTDRSRVVEKLTREWIDAKFPGVFDKLVFVDEDSHDDMIARKKELYEEFKVKVAIGTDGTLLQATAADVAHVVQVGRVAWNKNDEPMDNWIQVEDWSLVQEELKQLVDHLQLKASDKVFSGPKLAKYTDDLVTVSTKKPASFYANIINSKFSVQKQEIIRLQASESAITTAIQATEMLRSQKHAVQVTKISTRYAFKRARGVLSHRVPKIEIVLTRLQAQNESQGMDC